MMYLETWKYIPGYEGLYMVSDWGRVKSLPRTVKSCYGSSQFRPGRVLKPVLNSDGRLKVSLRKESHKPRQALIHWLVLEAFVGPKLKGLCVRHLNGDPHDNRLWNLRYGTHQENADDRKAHERTCRGSKNSRSKLTEEQVREIKARLVADTMSVLAKEFGVTYQNIYSIKHGKTWTHID